MRQTYVVTYDICEPKRLRQVFRVCLGFGEHLQYSVFRCDLTATELIELRSRLSSIINHHEDQVLFVHVGPADGRATKCFAAVGKPYAHEVERVIIV
jgi:CRISPR-associated protein Cas2